MQYKPAGYRILVRPETPEEINRTSLIEIPDAVRDRHQGAVTRGVIVAVGDLAWADQVDRNTGQQYPWAKVSDTVEFVQNAHVPVKIEGVDHFLVNDKDVLAVIVDDEATVE